MHIAWKLDESSCAVSSIFDIIILEKPPTHALHFLKA